MKTLKKNSLIFIFFAIVAVNIVGGANVCENLVHKSNGLIYLFDTDDNGQISSVELQALTQNKERLQRPHLEVESVISFQSKNCKYNSIDACSDQASVYKEVLDIYDQDQSRSIDEKELVRIQSDWVDGKTTTSHMKMALDGLSNLAVNPVTTKEPPCGDYGDVNGNGVVECCCGKDYIAALYGEQFPMTKDEKRRADVNGNGAVTIGDAMMIKEYVNGQRNSFPVCQTNKSTPQKPCNCETWDIYCQIDCTIGSTKNISGTCGNNRCDALDNIGGCSNECPTLDILCGNQICEEKEIQNCPQDCNLIDSCGNNQCDRQDMAQCPKECLTTFNLADSCGNGICESNEEIYCTQDCPKSTCGNNICNFYDYIACPEECIKESSQIPKNNSQPLERLQTQIKQGWNAIFLTKEITIESLKNSCNDVLAITLKNKQLYQEADLLTKNTAYLIRSSSECQIEQSPSLEKNTLNLIKGWNLVGSTTQIKIEELKNNCKKSLVIGLKDGNLYEESQKMYPYQGYLIRIPSNCSY